MCFSHLTVDKSRNHLLLSIFIMCFLEAERAHRKKHGRADERKKKRDLPSLPE